MAPPATGAGGAAGTPETVDAGPETTDAAGPANPDDGTEMKPDGKKGKG